MLKSNIDHGGNFDPSYCPGEDKCKSSTAKDYGCSLGSGAMDQRSCAQGFLQSLALEGRKCASGNAITQLPILVLFVQVEIILLVINS